MLYLVFACIAGVGILFIKSPLVNLFGNAVWQRQRCQTKLVLNLAQLNPGESEEKLLFSYHVKKAQTFLAIIFLGSIFAYFLWINKEQNKETVDAFTIFITGVVTGIFTWIIKDKDIEKEVEKKRSYMEAEYFVLVNKLTLYLGAGLNIYQAWVRMTESESQNPIYAEMRYTCKEMENGLSQAEALEAFAKRMRSQRYVRFITLLVQSLHKGNKELVFLLQQESAAAREERRVYVLQKGEEMGTKLLFPMILMMGIVMVLIMVPAFLSI